MQYSDTLLYSQFGVPVLAVGAGYIQVLLLKFAAIASVGRFLCRCSFRFIVVCWSSPVVT